MPTVGKKGNHLLEQLPPPSKILENQKLLKYYPQLQKKIPTIGNLVGTIKEVNTILNDPDDRSIDKMLSILEKRPKQLMKIRLIA